MSTKHRIFFLILIILMLLLIIILQSFAFTQEEQQEICDEVGNMSSFECTVFWEWLRLGIMQNFNLTEDCPACEPNVTIVNHTIFETRTVEANCSDRYEFIIEQNRHEEELQRINKGCPECEECPKCEIPDNYITNDECNLEISKEISSRTPPVQNNDKAPSWFYGVLIIIALLVVFFIYNKFKGRISPKFSPDFNNPQSKSVSYQPSTQNGSTPKVQL